MNQKRIERLLLLEPSGELSARQRRQLDKALAADAEARRQRDELRGLAAALPPGAAQPSAAAVGRIAARLRPPPKPAFAFSPAWKPALAAVAALTLLLGVRAFHPQPGAPAPATVSAAAEEEEWTDPLETEFAELESLIAGLDADETFEITEL